jgi:short-subunit dehydrogenase
VNAAVLARGVPVTATPAAGAPAKRAIVIGASSGIGRALALRLAREGYDVGLTARRLPLLLELQAEIGPRAFVKPMDVSDAASAMARLDELIAEMGGADLVVVNAGTGHTNPDLAWEPEQETIGVNVTGFAAMVNVAYRHFVGRGAGHLVSISSVAALRGSGFAPAYNASKAFVSTYMDGLRHKLARLGAPVAITDIQPGFVRTAMAQGPNVFWAASPEEAAEQIWQAIRRRRKRAVITRRWRPIAWLMRVVPDAVYHRLG